MTQEAGQSSYPVRMRELIYTKNQRRHLLYKQYSKEGIYIAKENKYVICDSYVIGYTKRGYEFYFDLEDFDVVKQYYWKIGSDGYIFTSSVSPKLSLHKLIIGEGIYIHKNGNKKDNSINTCI